MSTNTTTTLFYVEHRVTNKQGWDAFVNDNYFKIMAAEDMTIDKGEFHVLYTSILLRSSNLTYLMHIIGLEHPSREGNWGILSCSDMTGTFTVCVWQVPTYTTKQEFQDFIDRFSRFTAVNTVYSVQNILGNRLSPRKCMPSFI